MELPIPEKKMEELLTPCAPSQACSPKTKKLKIDYEERGKSFLAFLKNTKKYTEAMHSRVY